MRDEMTTRMDCVYWGAMASLAIVNVIGDATAGHAFWSAAWAMFLCLSAFMAWKSIGKKEPR